MSSVVYDPQRQRQHSDHRLFVHLMDSTTKPPRFLWDKGQRVAHLLEALKEYKAEMAFKSIDFDADKVKQYEAVRVKLAAMYTEEVTLTASVDTAPQTQTQTHKRSKA